MGVNAGSGHLGVPELLSRDKNADEGNKDAEVEEPVEPDHALDPPVRLALLGADEDALHLPQHGELGTEHGEAVENLGDVGQPGHLNNAGKRHVPQATSLVIDAAADDDSNEGSKAELRDDESVPTMNPTSSAPVTCSVNPIQFDSLILQ